MPELAAEPDPEPESEPGPAAEPEPEKPLPDSGFEYKFLDPTQWQISAENPAIVVFGVGINRGTEGCAAGFYMSGITPSPGPCWAVMAVVRSSGIDTRTAITGRGIWPLASGLTALRHLRHLSP